MNGKKALLILGLAAVLSTFPAAASCLSSQPLSSADPADPALRSFIWSETIFDPFYFPTYAPLDYQPPFAQVSASFWVLGMGDPASGMGIDSGSRNLVGTGDLSYGAHGSQPVFYAAGLNTDWSFPNVDGCPPAGGCTCLLLSDVDTRLDRGLFATVAAANDPLGTFFNLTGNDPLGNALPIVLQEIPRPVVTNVARPQADTVEIAVTVPSRAGGVYEAASGAGCLCGPAQFLIRYQVLDRGTLPLPDRSPAAWPVAPLAGGGAQGATATDGSVTVEATCAAGDKDVYLVTELLFDSGFSAAVVSGNSIPVECGGNLSGEFLGDVRDPAFEPFQSGGKRR